MMTAEQLTQAQAQQVAHQLEVIRRGTAEIVPQADLEQKVRLSVVTGKPLRVKLGLDPTAPDVHIGHTVVLQKIRQLQDLGHIAQLVIGDFTGRIGDPTDKSETRKQLTEVEVGAHAETYARQVVKVLDPEKTEIVYNSNWLSPLQFADVIQLAAHVTVARMLERDDFTKRFRDNRPIHIHEFFYPLMQGYDSVALETDIELGGTDQKFNLLMGRSLQKGIGKPQQVAVLMPLLEGLDGVKKMSKSLGNYIGIDEDATTMFGKVMSIPDALMVKYYELVSGISVVDLARIREGYETGRLHPRDLKLQLATELVARFHSAAAAMDAVQQWRTVFQEGAFPQDMPQVVVPRGTIWMAQLLVNIGLAPSKREARRNIEQGAVRVNGQQYDDVEGDVTVIDNMVIQVGKRRFVRCKVD